MKEKGRSVGGRRFKIMEFIQNSGIHKEKRKKSGRKEMRDSLFISRKIGFF
jgi:hypothetical protein